MHSARSLIHVYSPVQWPSATQVYFGIWTAVRSSPSIPKVVTPSPPGDADASLRRSKNPQGSDDEHAEGDEEARVA